MPLLPSTLRIPSLTLIIYIYFNTKTQAIPYAAKAILIRTPKERKRRMYPRVKVRVQEEEESLFFRLVGFQSKPEKENRINSPPSNSIPRITTTPKPLSATATKDAGTVENKKQIGRSMKSNVKPGSILPPRAVLSSPDNDGMIGRINKLDYERSWSTKKRPADVVKPTSPKAKTDNVNRSPIIAPCSPKVNRSPKITHTSPNVWNWKAPNPGLTASIRKQG